MADLKVFVCLPNFSGGGAERVMLTLINAFSSSAEITCIVLNENGPLRKKLPRSCIVKNFKCVSARAALLPLTRFLSEEKPDIVFSTLAYFNFVIVMAVLLSRHNPKRIILREANTPDSSLKSLPMEFIGRIGYRFLYNRAHHVICNSLHVSLRLAELGVKSERLEIIPNPVDLSDINMLADEVAIVPKFHDQNLPLFVSIGRLAVQKGMDRLIEWVAQMKMEANLLIIGEGSELSKITEKIDRHSCHGKVKVIGFQKNPFPFMAKSSAVLLGSRWEGLPNVALEALALGKKVIASRECESLLHLKNTFSVAKLSVPETDEAYVMALDDIACDFRINAKSTTAAPQSALPSEFNLKDVCDRYRKLIFGD